MLNVKYKNFHQWSSVFYTPYACLNNLCATATNANFLA
ncbi:hypothetical protein SULYE_1638, partial [Sulfurihydrogenibium yellowstonense SS-5]